LPDILGRSRAQHPWTIFHISWPSGDRNMLQVFT
jgi:hypothetical protein